MDCVKEYKLTRQWPGGPGDFPFVDQDSVSHPSPAAWLFGTIMGGCGCGSSEDFGDKAIELLHEFARPHHERKLNTYDDPFLELMAHWMHSADLLEHGSSIGGSWLSDKGKQVHAVILSCEETEAKA